LSYLGESANVLAGLRFSSNVKGGTMNSKNLYIVAAAASLAISIALYFGFGFAEDKVAGTYVGLWVGAILALGNLLAKKSK
jgi:hypothetical protein